MHLVIIGGVAAGTKAAARARRVNRKLAITLFQDETEVSYTACGQPYYLSRVVPTREALVIRKASDFKADHIDIKLRHRVMELDTRRCTVQVHNLENNAMQTVPYDRLIIATGARAIVPAIPGINLDGVVTLRSMAELDRFRSALDRLLPQCAVIVGSGYIGLEVAESLVNLGIKTTLLSRNQQVFSRLDPEMSQHLHEYLLTKNVQVLINEKLAEIKGHWGKVTSITTAKGAKLATDLVVLAIGAKPNAELADQAGIQLGMSGAIAVNNRMETNIEGVFAAGDCVECYHRLTQKPVWNPLGDIANLQGRIAGENAAGGNATFPGVYGTAIFKTFDLNIGLTGLTETAARQAGFDPISTVITARDKARYYPGAKELTLKLVAEVQSGRMLGAQAIGPGAVDKMVDIMATALLGNLSCRDLENADLAYAPPFSPVLSPIIIAASNLSKLLTG